MGKRRNHTITQPPRLARRPRKARYGMALGQWDRYPLAVCPPGPPVRHRQAVIPAFRTNDRSGRTDMTPAGTGLYHGTWWDQWDWNKQDLLDTVRAGRFTTLLPELRPAKFDGADLRVLADAMTPKKQPRPTPDPQEDRDITAAYTYLGQFVDHDLTFDPTSRLRESLDREQIGKLADFRTPRFDLDNLYGRGPDDQPYMYDQDVGFQEVREQVRWHYQSVLVNDFLPAVIEDETYRRVFGDPCNPRPGLRELRTGLRLMPVEFSVAAYRFGHSMIRPEYRLNTAVERPIFSRRPDDSTADLGGFRSVPNDWAIDWRFFIDLEPSAMAAAAAPLSHPVVRRPQHAYKIDTSLASPLRRLPSRVASHPS